MQTAVVIASAQAETTLQQAAHWAEIVTALMSFVVIVTVVLLARQVRQQALDGRTNLITTVGGAFIDHPETRKYFYKGATPTGEDDEAQAIAVSLAGAMDYTAAHFDHMPSHTREAWRAYFDFIYENSPVFVEHLEEHHSWYGSRFQEYFGYREATPYVRAWRRVRLGGTYKCPKLLRNEPTASQGPGSGGRPG